VFYAEGKNGPPLWTLSRASDEAERAEEERLLHIKLEKCLRSVFHKCVLRIHTTCRSAELRLKDHY
jgi:actin-related protein 10